MKKFAQSVSYFFIDFIITCSAEYLSIIGQNDFAASLRN